MTPIVRLTIQPTKLLTLKRVNNGWIVWIAGSPETASHAYLYLYDTGDIERIQEGPEAINVTKLQQ